MNGRESESATASSSAGTDRRDLACRGPCGMLRRSVFCAVVLLQVFPARAIPQGSIGDLVADFARRGRAISDLALDHAGNLHIAWTLTDSRLHEAGTLFYSRLDSSGRKTAESQITKFGGAYDIHLDVDSKTRAVVLYRELNRLCLAAFDEAGIMRTEPDRYLTSEETDARFESCRDEADNLFIVGRGAIDYVWKVDPAGAILVERRGRWIRQQTPGFVCQVVGSSALLIVWGIDSSGRVGQQSPKLKMLKFDLGSFNAGEPREYELARVAEAREAGILLAKAAMVRSGKDILLFASVTDSSSEASTYRVRFNVRGDPVRRWEQKRIYHLEVMEPSQGHCSYRTGLLRMRRTGAPRYDLQGLGSDGNMYHMTGKVTALQGR